MASTPNDEGARPLARRPEALEPLNNVDVEFIGSSGPTDVIRPNTEYELRATVHNFGGSDIPPSPIEFYVVPVLSRSAVAFDTTAGEIVLSEDPPYTITGWVLDRPGGEVRINIRGAGDAPFLLSQEVQTRADRTFSAEFDLSNIAAEETFEVQGNLTDSTDKFSVNQVVSARFDTENVTTPQPLPLAAEANATTFVGHRRVQHLAESESTVSLPFTTSSQPFASGFHRYTAIFVRAYSLSPLDLPDDLEVLDHTTSRQIGCREVYQYE